MASVTMTASSIALQPQQAAAQMRQRHADARCEYQVRSYSDLLQQKGQKRTKSGFRSNPPPFLTQHEITQYHRQYEKLIDGLNMPSTATRSLRVDKAARARAALWDLWYDSRERWESDGCPAVDFDAEHPPYVVETYQNDSGYASSARGESDDMSAAADDHSTGNGNASRRADDDDEKMTDAVVNEAGQGSDSDSDTASYVTARRAASVELESNPGSYISVRRAGSVISRLSVEKSVSGDGKSDLGSYTSYSRDDSTADDDTASIYSMSTEYTTFGENASDAGSDTTVRPRRGSASDTNMEDSGTDERNYSRESSVETTIHASEAGRHRHRAHSQYSRASSVETTIPASGADNRNQRSHHGYTRHGYNAAGSGTWYRSQYHRESSVDSVIGPHESLPADLYHKYYADRTPLHWRDIDNLVGGVQDEDMDVDTDDGGYASTPDSRASVGSPDHGPPEWLHAGYFDD